MALPALGELLSWVFSSGGKRLRPALVFAATRLGNVEPDRAMHLAAAIETLHAATLVHDDLVDGSLVRRGLPTINRRWGPSATVLAGDWLFARAAGFAAETEDIFANAQRKLEAKRLDLLVLNEVTADNPAFGDVEN